MNEMTMEKMVNLCKQYGFIFQGSEIYGGFANTWDDVIGITRYDTNDDQKMPGMYDVID